MTARATRRRRGWPLIASFALAWAATAAAQPTLDSGSIAQAAQRLRPGEYLWAPQVAPEGPVLLVVSLANQRAVLYRNGLPIGITTISTGRPGHRTPTGVFTVLERDVEHYSSLYNSAPMPFMQRLTWGGVALHGGHLPGYPASHGCIRLPHDFARLLFGVTHLGMTVIVTGTPAVPRVAPGDRLFAGGAAPPATATVWQPARAPSGPVSIVVSGADQRVLVLRNGTVIGSAPAEVATSLRATFAFVLAGIEDGHQRWLQVAVPGQGAQSAAADELRGQIRVDDGFRTLAAAVLVPGTTVVITPDSLSGSRTGQPVELIDSVPDRPARRR